MSSPCPVSAFASSQRMCATCDLEVLQLTCGGTGEQLSQQACQGTRLGVSAAWTRPGRTYQAVVWAEHGMRMRSPGAGLRSISACLFRWRGGESLRQVGEGAGCSQMMFDTPPGRLVLTDGWLNQCTAMPVSQSSMSVAHACRSGRCRASAQEDKPHSLRMPYVAMGVSERVVLQTGRSSGLFIQKLCPTCNEFPWAGFLPDIMCGWCEATEELRIASVNFALEYRTHRILQRSSLSRIILSFLMPDGTDWMCECGQCRKSWFPAGWVCPELFFCVISNQMQWPTRFAA